MSPHSRERRDQEPERAWSSGPRPSGGRGTLRPQSWEIVLDPFHEKRTFRVPEEALFGFLRSAASDGCPQFRISNGQVVFQITRLWPHSHVTREMQAALRARSQAGPGSHKDVRDSTN